MYDDILYEVEDPVATITLNRPDALNAWTGTMEREIHDALKRADADSSVVGVVITGAGRGFCAGADMNTLQDLSSREPSEAGDAPLVAPVDDGQVGDFDGRFPSVMAISKPVIAAVNGAVAGMAYPFSLCCDLRVGTENSLFVTAFAQRGLVAEWGLSWMLPRLVGPSVALDLLFSSRRVKGTEALELGLLNYLVEPDELLPFCRSYIENLAATSSPASMAIMKQQVYEQLHKGLGQAELDSQRLMVESFNRPDFAEGVKSFVERRAPQFPRLGD
ncbi:MAG: enoyl-CoA hydratase [Actinomycetia bacterium]|nr:enoyl-CoA hydratase [Actinomycetes bacterium]MCP4960481.1 enoyl-CoA hydratase [Actinomycetes bacterium]